VEYLDSTREKLIPEAIYMEGDKGIPVQVAMHYNTSYTENVFSYVNNINTIEGGTHVSGFRLALTRTLKNYADKSGMLDKLKIDISGDDFREGLTAVISVRWPNRSLRARPRPSWATATWPAPSAALWATCSTTTSKSTPRRPGPS
jgi:DNA gyrase/topoisomerase IV subunit B